MQSPWLIQVGRLAWARLRYEAIGGWRRLFWRLWWRNRECQAATVDSTPLPSLLAKPSGLMHWGVDGLPWCGANCRERWTRELEFATCPVCREEGERAMTAYWISTR
jgi:hypothetical protein